MKVLKSISLSVFGLGILFLVSCGDDDTSLIDNLLGLGPENDVAIGESVVQQIEADPNEYPILERSAAPEAYAYLDAMRADILSSDDIKHKDLFPYTFTIIARDDVLNAFATPGGFMYVYTGLIKYLDRADDLAGVLGHEIAHASERHGSDQLKQNTALQIALSAVGGSSATAEQAQQILAGLLSLQFSRSDENEADERSVEYLADTGYACNGAAGFFAKLEAEDQCNGSFAILSTHPDPCLRVDDINTKASELGCSTSGISETGVTYEEFKNLLP